MAYTERDKIARARTFVEKMSKGMNPITNEPLPRLDSDSEKRIRACMAYLTGMLDSILAGPARAGQPVSISPQLKSRIKVSPKPINISDVVTNINVELKRAGIATLSLFSVSAWLNSQGLLEDGSVEGKQFRIASDGANGLGINTVTRTGKDGRNYPITLYDEGAQRYIIENLEAITERKAGSSRVAGKA
ncbi:MAG: hypothetical protein FWG10_00750 [Eubacteriaceae bacterium]|nr:hypothetical protein [Eubacteriaceae bacterium]